MTVDSLGRVEPLSGSSRHSDGAFPLAGRSGSNGRHSERRHDGEADGDEGCGEGRQTHVAKQSRPRP